MSRVGRKPIVVPPGVEVAVDGSECRVKGPKGQLTQEIHNDVRVSVDGGEVVVTRASDQPEHRALHGLTRALIQNMVIGVTDGFRKSLELQGTGYRAQLQGSSLLLNVGFSHPVEMKPIDGATFEVETPTLLHISGVDKQVVGQQAALVRRVRPPEPYHGKGIRYRGEQIRLKAGKSRA
ncbi:MAG: 50S ribosomal protein L6 [Chloroflexi bacterium]|nr:50S ribosomal protein L6 [Chloroflexota bacterium]MDA1002587.1 50S ribosomal protein L6 [Chloroflexota bacterium]MQC27658.1 50S ribosomal protein L6 [Chloroflexota bacterium]